MRKVMSLLVIAAMGTTLLAGCSANLNAAAENYVAVDIQEAGIQFVVDSNDVVVAFSATTLEGEEIIIEADYIGEDIEDVVEDVIDTSIELGYIDPDALETDPNAVLVTAEHYKARNNEQWRERMRNLIDTKLQGKGIWSVVLNGENIPELAKIASQNGISVAKARMVMALQGTMPELTYADAAEMTQKEMMTMLKAEGPIADKLTGLDRAIANLEAELLTLDEVEDAVRISEIEATLVILNANKLKVEEKRATALANKTARKAEHQQATNQWKAEKAQRAQAVINGRANSNRPTAATVNSKRDEIGARFGG